VNPASPPDPEHWLVKWSLDNVHIWLGLSLLGALIVVCWRKGRWPELRQLVELLALGVGLHEAGNLFLLATRSSAESSGWGLMIGASVIACVSVRGIWEIVSAVLRGEKPVKPEPPDAAA